jgi:hypothetical protein
MNELKADHPFADLLPNEVPLRPCGVVTAQLDGVGAASVVFLDLSKLSLQRICDIAERFALLSGRDGVEVITDIVKYGLPIRTAAFRSPPVIGIDARLVT